MVEAELEGVKGVSPSDLAQSKARNVVLESAQRGVSAMRKQFSTAAAVLLGAIAFSLGRRTREVGIRMAIGATPARIACLFAGYAGIAIIPGMLLGFAGFLMVRRDLNVVLFGDGLDPAVPVVVTALLLVLSCVAAITVPLLRATNIDPAVALREQ